MTRILVATDLSERSDRAIHRAVMLAKQHDADLSVVHIVDEELPSEVADDLQRGAQTAIEHQLSSLPGAQELNVTTTVAFGKDWTEISRLALSDQCDLIVLGMHREHALRDLFKGTTVERLVRKSGVPVLVVKDRPTKPYQRIVAGVDFSASCRRAIDKAVAIAPEASLHLVHANTTPMQPFLGAGDIHGQLSKKHAALVAKTIEREMAGLVEGLAQSPDRLTKNVREGEVHAVLANEVENYQADLLVLGTHGRTGVAHALIGSIAESFLTRPPCDVLAVKAW